MHFYRESEADIKKINETQWSILCNWWGGWMFGQEGEIGELPFWQVTSGIMLFSSHDAARRLFEMVMKIRGLTRCYELDLFGDQPVLNYVATQMEIVDVDLLYRRSINGSDIQTLLLSKDRMLKHISLGVGESKRKLDIMLELFNNIHTAKE